MVKRYGEQMWLRMWHSRRRTPVADNEQLARIIMNDQHYEDYIISFYGRARGL